MATPEELAASYTAAWTERDPARRTALRAIVVFGDPGPPPGATG